MPFSSEILSIDISRLALEFIAGGEKVTTSVSVSCFVPFSSLVQLDGYCSFIAYVEFTYGKKFVVDFVVCCANTVCLVAIVGYI